MKNYECGPNNLKWACSFDGKLHGRKSVSDVWTRDMYALSLYLDCWLLFDSTAANRAQLPDIYLEGKRL